MKTSHSETLNPESWTCFVAKMCQVIVFRIWYSWSWVECPMIHLLELPPQFVELSKLTRAAVTPRRCKGQPSQAMVNSSLSLAHSPRTGRLPWYGPARSRTRARNHVQSIYYDSLNYSFVRLVCAVDDCIHVSDFRNVPLNILECFPDWEGWGDD